MFYFKIDQFGRMKYEIYFGYDNNGKLRKEFFVNDMPSSLEGPIINENDSINFDKFLIELFNNIEIQKWKRNYFPKNIVLDGEVWLLEVRYMNTDNVILEGSNEYPNNYDDLLALINHYIGTKF